MNNNNDFIYYQSDNTGKRRKPKGSGVATLAIVLVAIVLVALLTLGVLVGSLFISGMRYIVQETETGETIKFLGTVDGDGDYQKGKLFYSNGLRATLDMEKGTVTFTNGDVYEGELDDLQRDGYGKYTFKNGDVYEGEFFRDAFTGEGKISFACGDVYEGEFKDGLKHGSGKYTWANGDVYEGEFVNDTRDAEEATMTYYVGEGKEEVYVGSYKNDLKDGEGRYTFANGDIYVGEFKNDMRDGIGTYTFANGDLYVGEFKADNLDGEGEYTWASGRTSGKALFQNGVYIKTAEETNS